MDGTNLLYRTFYANLREGNVDLAFHSAFITLQKYCKQYDPETIFMCFDTTSWRKKYTESDKCLSQKKYKANRRQNMTPSQEDAYKIFLTYMNDFAELLDKYTTVRILRSAGLEADDIIAGLAQVYSDRRMIIVSADKDFIQLLANPNITLIDPTTGKPRSLDEWNGDADYYMFFKCVRGDPIDNVQSAFPRARKTRIAKAYKDEFERVNLMKETWKDEEGREFTVENLFNENMLLMHLWSQPEDIKVSILTHIDEKTSEQKKFNYFQVLRFLGLHDLKDISNKIDSFVPLLSR